MTKLIEGPNNKELKTFSIHETDLSFVRHIKSLLFQYKHLENILNILLQQQFNKNQILLNHKDNNLDKESELILGKEMFNLLLNPIIMKAVLNHNTGGIKTKETIAKVNNYFQHNNLFNQAIQASKQLNDKNISMIIRRLKKDWSNYFSSLKDYNQGNKLGLTGKPSYPKAKKLSQVFNYSVPLESDKFSLKKSHKGLLGITLGKKMFYVYIGNSFYFKDKVINNVTISYSHGHIYYNFTYTIKSKNLIKDNESNLIIDKISKVAGGDIGLNNLLSLFINDHDTISLIISGKELISYNCHFNKRLAKINNLISQQIKFYKTVTSKVNNKDYQVPEVYTYEGQRLIKKKSQLFERRKLFMADYMNKVAKKILVYLSYYKVTDLVLSKNLSFVKTNGSIHMNKRTKQKFYQIPFGSLLNLIEQKVINYGINITWINESYTSKTSSLSSNIVEVQNKSFNKKSITPSDLNGNRGAKVKGKINNKLGRGLFKDIMINKIINADLNAACNHIKVGLQSMNLNINLNNIIKNMSLRKFCNPIKIKSNHEFDILLTRLRIVDIQLSNDNKEIYYLT